MPTRRRGPRQRVPSKPAPTPAAGYQGLFPRDVAEALQLLPAAADLLLQRLRQTHRAQPQPEPQRQTQASAAGGSPAPDDAELVSHLEPCLYLINKYIRENLPAEGAVAARALVLDRTLCRALLTLLAMSFDEPTAEAAGKARIDCGRLVNPTLALLSSINSGAIHFGSPPPPARSPRSPSASTPAINVAAAVLDLAQALLRMRTPQQISRRLAAAVAATVGATLPGAGCGSLSVGQTGDELGQPAAASSGGTAAAPEQPAGLAAAAAVVPPPVVVTMPSLDCSIDTVFHVTEELTKALSLLYLTIVYPGKLPSRKAGHQTQGRGGHDSLPGSNHFAGQFLSYMEGLAASLADSHVLEHSARAVVVAMQLGVAVSVQGEGAADSVSAGITLRSSVDEAVQVLIRAVQGLGKALFSPSDAGGLALDAAVLLRGVLSGTCVQFLVLAAGLAALCAADGGASYGISEDLLYGLKRAMGCLDKPYCAANGLVRPQRVVSMPALSATALLNLMSGLTRKLVGPPLTSRRAVVELLLRAGRLAVASARHWGPCEEEVAVQRGGGLSSGADSMNPTEQQSMKPQSLLMALPRGYVPFFAVNLLPVVRQKLSADCGPGGPAVAAGGRWRAGAAIDRWRLTVNTVAHAPWWQRDSHTQSLAGCLRPHVVSNNGSGRGGGCGGGQIAGEGDDVPAELPPPDVAAALAGGLLPCLERLIRRACRNPTGPEVKLLEAVARRFDDPYPLVHLLAFGEKRQVASFLATMRKVNRRTDSLLSGSPGGGPSGHASGAVSGSVGSAVQDIDCLGGLFTELQCSILHEIPALLFPLCAALEPATAAAGAGGSSPQTTGAAAVLQQLTAVTSSAAAMGLPRVANALAMRVKVMLVSLGSDQIDTRRDELFWFLAVCCFWINLLAVTLAERNGTAAADAPNDSGSSSNSSSTSDRSRQAGVASGGSAGSTSASPDADDGGWRVQLLLRCHSLTVLGAGLRAAQDPQWRHILREFDSDGGEDSKWLVSLAEGLVLVTSALPYKVREEAAAAATMGGSAGRSGVGRGDIAGHSSRGNSTGSNRTRRAHARAQGHRGKEAAAARPMSYWPPELVRSLAAELRAADQCGEGLVQAVEALAARLERWGAGGGAEDDVKDAGPEAEEPIATLPLMGRVAVAARSLGPPTEVASWLRTCANPACVNLQGDSEAELRLSSCGRCGTAWYCSRDCQTEHWRAGHRAECSRGAAPAAAGSGVVGSTGAEAAATRAEAERKISAVFKEVAEATREGTEEEMQRAR